MNDLVIVGHGGLAREAAFLVREVNESSRSWNFMGFISSHRKDVGSQIAANEICGDDEWLTGLRQAMSVVIAIGNPGALPALHQRFASNPRLSFPSLIHPKATGDWGRIQMGDGNIIFNGVAFTTDIAMGSFNILNPGCTISHDCRLGSYNLLGPGVHLAGGVSIGNSVLIGTGASILPAVSISDGAVIGAGAAVVRDICEPGSYIGVPARRKSGQSQ